MTEREKKYRYEFVPCLDSGGNDIDRLGAGKSIEEMKALADKTPDCAGFNSNGWFKRELRPRNQWSRWTNDSSKGFYVKKAAVVQTPNILFIIADDLGVDVLKFIDDKAIAQAPGTKKYLLPNLTKLVKNGVNFTRAWSHPVCSPARATMYTGLHPWENGVGFAGFTLNPPVGPPFTEAEIKDRLKTVPPRQTNAVYEIPLQKQDTGERIETYAEILKAAGYTCSFFGKWDQGYMLAHQQNGPIDRGWDHFEGVFGGGVDPRASNTPDLDPRLYWTWVKQIQDVDDKKNGRVIQRFQKSPEADAADVNYPAKLVKDAVVEGTRQHAYATADSIHCAREWIKKKAGVPWCTTLALHAPHYPYHVPPTGTYTIDEFKPIILEKKTLHPTQTNPQTGQEGPNPEYLRYVEYLKAIGQAPATRANEPITVEPVTIEPNAPGYLGYLNGIGASSVQEQTKFVAMIESLDYYLGELLNDPKLTAELEKTVIFFIGDNGSPTSVVDLDSIPLSRSDYPPDDDGQKAFEKDQQTFTLDPIKEGKRTIYMPGANVPLIVADGGSLTGNASCYLDRDDMGTDNTSLVQASDLFSTFTDMAQGKRQSTYKLDTFSLVPYLQDCAPEAPRRKYNFAQYFLNIDLGVPPNPTNRATISDGDYKLNFRGKVQGRPGKDVYEFAKLESNPVTGFQVERFIDDFNHPKAKELYDVLRTKYRASSGFGNIGTYAASPPCVEFPDLPKQFNRLLRVLASGTYTQQLAGFGTIRPGQFQIGGIKQMPYNIGGLEAYRAKVTFDLSHIQKDTIKKATLYLTPTELESIVVHVEPLVDPVAIYPPEASDASQRVSMRMGGDDRYEFDVTTIVQGWVANPATNLGFRVYMRYLTDGQAVVWERIQAGVGKGNRLYSTSSGPFAAYGAYHLGSFPDPQIIFYNHQNSVFGPVLVIESTEVETLT